MNKYVAPTAQCPVDTVTRIFQMWLKIRTARVQDFNFEARHAFGKWREPRSVEDLDEMRKSVGANKVIVSDGRHGPYIEGSGGRA